MLQPMVDRLMAPQPQGNSQAQALWLPALKSNEPPSKLKEDFSKHSKLNFGEINNFSKLFEFINKNKGVTVYFYSESITSTKVLFQQYEEEAKTTKIYYPELIFLKVNTDIDPDIVGKWLQN